MDRNWRVLLIAGVISLCSAQFVFASYSLGDSGDAVKDLQRRLTQAGCLVRADGRFNETTVSAVKKFQKKHNLDVDGVVGPVTYKALTGLDEPVIRFLEDDGEILHFLEHVYQLADHHVARYMQRGFTHLMFSFGCTGGQHRSVYCAQHLAQHIHEKFGIEVQILHREQHIEQVLKARN